MKSYTLEDVQNQAAKLQDFVTANLGKSDKTDPLLNELVPLNYAPQNFDEAIALNNQVREIEIRHHKTVMAELKAMGKGQWPGVYVIHDLICEMAHFGFLIRYAMKDTASARSDYNDEDRSQPG